MKEESGADASAHSRKRKANVAVVSTKEAGGEAAPLTWAPAWALPLGVWRGGTPRGGRRGQGSCSRPDRLSPPSLCVFGLGAVRLCPWGWGVVPG